jgi:hypothetical protein
VYWGAGYDLHTSLSMASHSATKEEALTLMRSSVAASRLVRVHITTRPKLRDVMKETPEQSAATLSMDPGQVRLILADDALTIPIEDVDRGEQEAERLGFKRKVHP